MKLTLRHKLIKLLRLFISFSFEGEDKMLLELMMQNKMRIGTYLDIGAYHPWIGSNTFLLYLWGWSGTCVDISNKWKFRLFRHRDKYIYGYVEAGTSYLFPRKLRTSSSEISSSKLKQGWRYPKVKSVPWIEAHQFKDYDLLDLDVDGIDIEILVKLLSYHRPKWILAEDSALPEQNNIYSYLNELGYKRIAKTNKNGLYERDDYQSTH